MLFARTQVSVEGLVAGAAAHKSRKVKVGDEITSIDFSPVHDLGLGPDPNTSASPFLSVHSQTYRHARDR